MGNGYLLIFEQIVCRKGKASTLLKTVTVCCDTRESEIGRLMRAELNGITIPTTQQRGRIVSIVQVRSYEVLFLRDYHCGRQLLRESEKNFLTNEKVLSSIYIRFTVQNRE